jgi:hypothetical protein
MSGQIENILLPERAQTNEKEKIRQDETRRDLTVGDR